MLAAAAIPGVLPPVRHGEHLLVDGGVVNNTPISHAIELGAERIYVLPSELIVLPAVNPYHVQPTDFGHASRLIGQALAAARTVLDVAPVSEAVAA